MDFIMSRLTGGFGATVCHLGGAAALAVAAGSKPNVDTSMPMTDRLARLCIPA